MVKEVINALDPTKASNPDCIPVVFLKSELYIANSKKSRFPDSWKVSSVARMSPNAA